MWLSQKIEFPNLGITIDIPSRIALLGDASITINSLLLGVSIVAGFLVVCWQAARTKQDRELYLDFALYALPISLLGARLYYIIFSLGRLPADPILLIELKEGQMAVYGAILAGIVTAFFYSGLKRLDFWRLADTACVGLLAGQIIGRWGDFFSRRSFGGYTDGPLAMRLGIHDVLAGRGLVGPADTAISVVSEEMIVRSEIGGYPGYIQVHPVFLYEAVWNLFLLFFLLALTKHKKFEGELFLLYLIGYSCGRFWIEGMRTDPLYVWGTELPVSQVAAALLIGFGLLAGVYQYWHSRSARP